MITNGTSCYLFKLVKSNTARIYHRTQPDYSISGDGRWNTLVKEDAGCFTKEQWKERSLKWAFNQGWMLESITGEVEAL